MHTVASALSWTFFIIMQAIIVTHQNLNINCSTISNDRYEYQGSTEVFSK